MTLPEIGRLLVVLGRLLGFAAAVFTIAFSVWWESGAIHFLFFTENSTWREVGYIPEVLALRICIAVLVLWSVFRLVNTRQLLYLFFVVGIGSFLGLFGWYFMLVGSVREFISFDNLPYLLAVCDLLYVVAGLVVGCTLLWPAVSGRTSNDSL